jgi:uncharacterized membrane protein
MIKNVSGTFVRGALTVLPVALTVYLVYYLLASLARISDRALKVLFPEFLVFPGAGLLLVLFAIYCVGVLMGSSLAQRAYSALEQPFKRLPVIRDLYMAIKQLADYLKPADDRQPNRVVLVNIPGHPVALVGFLMRDSFDDQPRLQQDGDRVAVYFPMSYQIGGYTVFLPRDWISPVEMGVDEAMRGTLTGWAGSEQ